MLAANRANARKSRGPVTALGKMLSRGNAAKHWGRAETIRDLMFGARRRSRRVRKAA